MAKAKVLVSCDMHDSFVPNLEKLGYECDYLPSINQAQILHCIAAYVGLIFTTKTQINEEFLEKARSLRFVARVGSGLDNVDLPAAADNNIVCLSAPEGNCNAVAEHVLGLIFNLLRNISKSNSEIKKGIWQREANRGRELASCTAGVIGYGHNGSLTAKKLIALGAKVLVYDKYKSNFSGEGVIESNLDEIQQNADIISLHVPLNDSSKNMIDENFISNLANSVYLINASRGEVLSLEALKKGLENGKIIGAALDVLEGEKRRSKHLLEDELMQYFINNENVILSPHIAGWTIESKRKISDVLLSKIEHFNID